MSSVRSWLAIGLLPLAGAIGIDAGGGGSAQAAASGLRCEIRVHEQSAGVTLEGVVHANAAVTGSYRLEVSKTGGGGSSDISQSGEFSAGPGELGSLGTVMLGGDPGAYVARLEVTAGGVRVECSEHFSGEL